LTALEGHERPAVGKLLFVLLLPIVLILIQTLAGSLHIGGPAQTVLDILAFLGTPWLALTITVFCAYAMLLTPRVRRGESISFFGMQGMKPVGEILVSTGGGVAFGSIIGASGVGKQLLDTLADIHLPLVLFGFVLAAILRATLGTTTAAVTFVAVLLAQSFDTTSLNPSQIALLAVGVSAGGMCLSNFNDAGFWVLSRYFGISEQVMLKTWTAGVTIMGCVTAAIASLLWVAVS
jgi:GntP family gluconate:H+ symporter